MRNLLLASACFLVAIWTVSADEPPPWREFEQKSPNKKFVAKVTVKDKKGKQYAWEWSYALAVYRADDLNKPLWSCDYTYDGYPSGLLTDDGKEFVYVNFWYYEVTPVVTVYRDGKRVKTWKGSDFGIDKAKLERTASHQLRMNPREMYRLTGTKELTIPTIDGRQRVIDLDKLELKP